jgi:outer membrane beta-barrel protein
MRSPILTTRHTPLGTTSSAAARAWAWALLCSAALAALPARADEVIYGPDGAPTVVQRKLHTMTGKTEIAFRGSLSLNTALVDHFGGMLSVSYHPNEWFDIGADLFGNYTALSSLATQIREKLPPRADSQSGKANTGDEIANAGQLRAGGFAVARIAPVYGKLDFASEFKVHLQAYLLVGVGAGLLHSESVNLCAVAGKTACSEGNFQVTDSVAAMGEVGGGFRFYLGQSWSMNLEIRAVLFPASIKQASDLTNPSSGTSASYLGLVTNLNLGLARTF